MFKRTTLFPHFNLIVVDIDIFEVWSQHCWLVLVEAGHEARLEGGVVGWKKDQEKCEDRCKLVVHNQDSANMWALRSWEDFFRRQPVCISASAYPLKDEFHGCFREGGQVKNNLFFHPSLLLNLSEHFRICFF